MILNAQTWAENIFGQAQLGDRRRATRLVNMTASLANNIGKSMAKASSSHAEMDAAYRFIRNPQVKAEAITEAGFTATAQQAENYPVILALEDTTSLSFPHASVRDELGYTTSSLKSSGTEVHSILLKAADRAEIIGLIEQTRWNRNRAEYGKKKLYKTIDYADKESFKWQRASMNMAKRLGTQMEKVISVCDRESDIIEYLNYKTVEKQRFVIRSSYDRLLEGRDDICLSGLVEQLEPVGVYQVRVEQRGGRVARVADLELRFCSVRLKAPLGKQGLSTDVNYVQCREVNGGDLCWNLLTSEQVTNADEARQIVGYYEQRWMIEEYHKAWKSGGTDVESMRMETGSNLERMIVILSFVAVRVLQIRMLGLSKVSETMSCESAFSTLEWKLLWKSKEKGKLPETPPSLRWAYITLAKLGGWRDSKRTGRAGWEVLWSGWYRLQGLREGYELARADL